MSHFGLSRRFLTDRNIDSCKFYFVTPCKMNFLDTTRPPRPGEVDGAVGNYYFVDKEEMEKQQKMGYFFEVGVHNNNLYG